MTFLKIAAHIPALHNAPPGSVAPPPHQITFKVHVIIRPMGQNGKPAGVQISAIPRGKAMYGTSQTLESYLRMTAV